MGDIRKTSTKKSFQLGKNGLQRREEHNEKSCYLQSTGKSLEYEPNVVPE